MANLGSNEDTPCTYSADLMCSWYATKVVSTKALRIYVPQTNATDMYGAIRFADEILPGVERIEVFAGDFIDIVYLKDKEGWRAESLRSLMTELKNWLERGLK